MRNIIFLIVLLLASVGAAAQCDSTIDLALGRTAVASSLQDPVYPASNAVDGDTTGSRWASAFQDSQYIYIDLGNVYDLCQIKLYWEAAYATDFNIDVSSDAVSWTTIDSVRGNTSLQNSFSVGVNARYVRMFGIHRATGFGFSLYEILVFGIPTCNTTNLALNQPAVASTTQSGFPASNAVDGLISTRWSSDYADSQWIYVDLGSVHTLCEVDVSWETAFASDYNIDVSDDASSWTTVDSIRGNTSIANINTVLGASGRYVRIFGIHRATSFGFSIQEMVVRDIMDLPVNFLSFTGEALSDGRVQLRWSISGEVNNDHYEIERSGDRMEGFGVIGRVAQAGHSYDFVDSFPLAGVNFYRLRQVDRDGKSGYSKVVTVGTRSSEGAPVLYPNPARDLVYLRTPANMTIRRVVIYNAAGMMVQAYSGGKSRMSVAGLAPGIYWVRVDTDEMTYTLRLARN